MPFKTPQPDSRLMHVSNHGVYCMYKAFYSYRNNGLIIKSGFYPFLMNVHVFLFFYRLFGPLIFFSFHCSAENQSINPAGQSPDLNQWAKPEPCPSCLLQSPFLFPFLMPFFLFILPSLLSSRSLFVWVFLAWKAPYPDFILDFC